MPQVVAPSLQTIMDTFREVRDGRESRAEYTASRDDRYRPRLRGVVASGSGADYHYANESQFFRMIERFREYARNDVIVRQGIRRIAYNVLRGDGIKADPDTGNEDLDKAISERWYEWCNNPSACDAAEEWTLQRIGRFALENALIDGDFFALGLRASGQLQSVEAHRIRTPNRNRGALGNIIHGVELNALRKRVNYWVLNDDIDPMRQQFTPKMFTAMPVRNTDGIRQCFQVYDPDRYSQTRGVSVMAPICTLIGMHNDLQFAKLVQAHMVSCYAIIRTFSPDFSGTATDLKTGERTTEQFASGGTKTIEEFGPGLTITADAGETITGFSPNVPNPEFFQHAMILLTIIAINLGIPVHVLLLDPTKTNFSGWRGAINEARTGFKAVQSWMIERFFRPVYEWKLLQWATVGDELGGMLTDAGAAALYARWNCPVWEYIQPEVEAEADAVRLDKMLISPRRLHAERGRDWTEVAQEIVADRQLIIEQAMDAAIVLRAKDPDISWRDLAPLEAKEATPPEPEPAPEAATGE